MENGGFDDMEPGSYYDDLGGAMYFADDEESFSPRTPAGPGCGCAAVFILFIPAISALRILLLK